MTTAGITEYECPNCQGVSEDRCEPCVGCGLFRCELCMPGGASTLCLDCEELQLGLDVGEVLDRSSVIRLVR